MNQANPLNVTNIDRPIGGLVGRCLQVRHEGHQRLVSPADCPFRLGRGHGSALLLNSDAASREHGVIEWLGDRFYYSDDSRNGTYLLDGHGEEVFVHHERVALPKMGILSPGHPVLDQTASVVRFKLPSTVLADSTVIHKPSSANDV